MTMSINIDDPDAGMPPYSKRILVLPGDPSIAYRPGTVLVDERANTELDLGGVPIFVADDDEGEPIRDLPEVGQWYELRGVENPPARVAELTASGQTAELDIVYFANDSDCCGCPPHPALVAEHAAGPWAANPWKANPWKANPWKANPWKANAESLNLLATGKAPMSSVMPADERSFPERPLLPTRGASADVSIGVLDSGLAGGRKNSDGMRPELFGTSKAQLARITGTKDKPSAEIGQHPADNYLDPVAGHGTFIAGIIEQLTPGCKIRVHKVFQPEGDVSASVLARELWRLMSIGDPKIVNFSFGGTGRSVLFERLIGGHRRRGVVFVAAAGNEGSCVEQYPAALDSVIGVAGLGPDGPAPWSNYGNWVDACAPGTDIVSSFFAKFDGDIPRINGVDADSFDEWATWSGTSFAAPVVVAALAREMRVTGCSATEAVDRLIDAPHLSRLPYMGTVVNF